MVSAVVGLHSGYLYSMWSLHVCDYVSQRSKNMY